MNKRIKQLAEQAHVTVLTTKGMENIVDGCYIISPDKLDKFAELILIEVTDILSTYRGKMVFEDGAEYNHEHPIIAIRKHFGVKE